jgi:hypothetical protein
MSDRLCVLPGTRGVSASVNHQDIDGLRMYSGGMMKQLWIAVATPDIT